MSGSLSNYAENALLNHLLGTPFSAPDVYVGLSRSDPLDDGSGLDEPTGDGYARVLHDDWTTAASREVANNGAVTFPAVTGAGWGTISHVALFDAETGGNLLAHTPLAASKLASAGNAFSIGNGEIRVGFRRWKLYFTSGGTYEVQVGDEIVGNTSGVTALVDHVELLSGVWASGTAAGYFWVSEPSGNFGSETLAVGVNADVASITGDLVGGVSNYLAHKLLDLMFSGTAYTAPDLYLALSSACPRDDASGKAEPSGNNYSRTEITGTWETVVDGLTDNDGNIELPVPSGSWGTLNWLVLMDAATSGNMLLYGKLYTPQSPGNGDTVTVLAGALNLVFDRFEQDPVTTTTTTTTTAA